MRGCFFDIPTCDKSHVDRQCVTYDEIKSHHGEGGGGRGGGDGGTGGRGCNNT